MSGKENCGSFFSELSVVEIKKASAAPRELYSPSVTKRKKKLFRMETVEIKQNATLKHKTEGRSNKYNK
ncbi:hypothetical protein DPMN_101022 [Dreissena polymorpha]|uniref:Uncharacterized protein n=1 Tax=Dreissena polymorpha TaxID=45954 RepID=A0A9D4LGX8_DREPO|nr:hypothetical protein DPMN_101022 [Dreissena polymorpha]